MKSIHNLSAALVFGMTALPAAAETCDGNEGFTLMLHGGLLDYEEEVGPHHRVLFKQLLENGREHLTKGGSALDVVVDSIAAHGGLGHPERWQRLHRQYRGVY